jgi:hypothetical protein
LVATAGAQLGQVVIKTDVATLSANLALRP